MRLSQVKRLQGSVYYFYCRFLLPLNVIVSSNQSSNQCAMAVRSKTYFISQILRSADTHIVLTWLLGLRLRPLDSWFHYKFLFMCYAPARYFTLTFQSALGLSFDLFWLNKYLIAKIQTHGSSKHVSNTKADPCEDVAFSF